MKFTESPVNGRPSAVRRGVTGEQAASGMPLHLNGVLMTTTQFQPLQYTRARANSGHVPGQDTSLVTRDTMPTIGHRTSSLEMLNNDFEEKRAFIASTLSLNDLLKPSSQEYRGPGPPMGGTQFSPMMTSGYMTNLPNTTVNTYNMLPLLKPNTNGYNVNFLNNGIPDKDLGKFT